MEQMQFDFSDEELDESLINLPSLDSPLIQDGELTPPSGRSVESVIVSRRERYKMMKLKSTPIMNSVGLKSKIGSIAKQNCTSYKISAKSRILNIESEYQFIKTLGVGTYGEVKLASVVSDSSKYVAIKIAKGHTSIQMLKNESEILKTLNHEGFPKFIDFQEDEFGKKAYLIIEYFEGQTLDMFLDDNTLSEQNALSHLESLVNAIEYLHSCKVAHRDLKPQNVIVTKENKVKIIDFNISKKFIIRSNADDSQHNPASAVNFEDKQAANKFNQKFFTQICSPMFAAPEILSADGYSESVDIWGLGVIFISMLGGIKIFNKGELKTQDESSLSQMMRSISLAISDKTVHIASIMLSNNPESRPTISELCSLIGE